ncbi:MAG: RHS repeat domain-containing protein, partial [Myxococcota bacterium]
MDLGEVVLSLAGGSNLFRHMDFRGNVLFVSKSNGTVEGRATYHGFGTSGVSGQLGERGFAQGFEVSSLGLVVLGPRVLDSATGRFLSQDPVFNAVNQYAYAQGNPVFFWDPDGAQLSEAQASGVYSVAGFGGAIAGTLVGAPGGLVAAGTGAYFGRLYAILAAWTVVKIVSTGSPRPKSPDILFPFIVPV